MTTRTIDLPEEQVRFIRDTVAAGRFHDESEVVRAALLLLEREEAGELRVEIQNNIGEVENAGGVNSSLKEGAGNQWPEGFFETVFGGWEGELVRPEQGEFEARESFD